jgi:predicted branched-subunit amino acid permease
MADVYPIGESTSVGLVTDIVRRLTAIDVPRQRTFRDGIRLALPLFLPTLAIGVSFGVIAQPVIGATAASVMSVVVFAGSAQVASVTVLESGGAVVAAVAAGLLLNLRFMPMSFAITPNLHGSRWRRFLEAQLIVDASFALSADGRGGFSREVMMGGWVPQACGWIGGTVVGVLAGGVLPEPATLGLDAIFPAFFLSILVGEARANGAERTLEAIFLAAVITLALLPWAPPGVPIIAASAAALLGLRR